MPFQDQGSRSRDSGQQALRRSVLVLAGGLWAAAGALAEEPAAGGGVPPPAPIAAPTAREPSQAEKLLDQKYRLGSKMVNDSPVSKRVASSGSAEARAELEKAREALARAEVHRAKGEVDKASAALNVVMSLVGRAGQLAADPELVRKEQRQRFGEQLRSVESLVASYRFRLGQVNAQGGEHAARQGELSEVLRMVEEAKGLAAVDALDDALRVLAAAEATVHGSFKQMVGGNTVVYTQKFSSRSEEYQFESDRMKSLAELIPVALAELRPSDGARRLVQRYVEQSEELRLKSRELADKQDFEGALTRLREATGHLQRALTAAGVVTPGAPTD